MALWKRPSGRETHGGANASGGMSERRESYPIHFDMMLKGNIAFRGRKQVRQVGVTVNGSTHLVTSGDVVDRQVYEALLAIGAITPHGPKQESRNG